MMPSHSSDFESTSEIRAQHHVLPNKAEQYITGDTRKVHHSLVDRIRHRWRQVRRIVEPMTVY